MARTSDTSDYRSTGECCACSNRAVKFEAIRGTIFEYCFVHGRTIYKEPKSNGRR